MSQEICVGDRVEATGIVEKIEGDVVVLRTTLKKRVYSVGDIVFHLHSGTVYKLVKVHDYHANSWVAAHSEEGTFHVALSEIQIRYATKEEKDAFLAKEKCIAMQKEAKQLEEKSAKALKDICNAVPNLSLPQKIDALSALSESFDRAQIADSIQMLVTLLSKKK